MNASAPKIRKVSDLKSALFQPALTSHYECYFNIPGLVNTFINQGGVNETSKQELLIMSCSEASLPGSQLNTHELNNDFTGVTQRHAYRRLYDDRADFTFYVNNRYSQILIFERWIQFISGEQISGSSNLNSFYRVKYPEQYKTNIYITKFERSAVSRTGKDIQNATNGFSYSGSKLYYSFYNSFPTSIASMPVSYESSSLLKCTVSFTYDRYVTTNTSTNSNSQNSSQSVPPGSPTAVGVPDSSVSYNPVGPVNPQTQAAINAGYTRNLNSNISPNQYGISAGSITNNSFEGEEIINALPRRVEDGLPYVGRNRGPTSTFSTI